MGISERALNSVCENKLEDIAKIPFHILKKTILPFVKAKSMTESGFLVVQMYYMSGQAMVRTTKDL
jgi:hypothetical protein